jgi:hypothetical protein
MWLFVLDMFHCMCADFDSGNTTHLVKMEFWGHLTIPGCVCPTVCLLCLCASILGNTFVLPLVICALDIHVPLFGLVIFLYYSLVIH